MLESFLQNNGAFKAFLGLRLTLGKEERLPAMLANSTLEDANNLDESSSVCVTKGRQNLSKTLPSKYSSHLKSDTLHLPAPLEGCG